MIYEFLRLTKTDAMDLLSSLHQAREKAMPWRILAGRLAQLEASAPLAPDGQPWIRAVEAISGFSANHLRRMSKASSLIEVMVQRWPDHAGILNALSFTHAEVLGRLWEADAAAVEHLLKAERWPSYGALLAQYEKARSRRSAPKAAGKLALGNFRDRVNSFLEQKSSLALFDRVPHHPYLKPDFLAFLPNGQIIAWDCMLMPEKVDQEALHRRFAAWATEASFVTEFWIAVQHDRGMDHMHRCIMDLDLKNIGVMAFGGSGAVISPHGPPAPDRRKSAVNTAFAPSLQSRGDSRN